MGESLGDYEQAADVRVERQDDDVALTTARVRRPLLQNPHHCAPQPAPWRADDAVCASAASALACAATR